MKRILMLTDLSSEDFTAGDFAGLSLRIWSIARILCQAVEVTIATKSGQNGIDKNGIKLIKLPRRINWKKLCDNYDYVYILQSSLFQSIGFRYAISKISKSKQTIVDCYTPLLFEKLTYIDKSPDQDGRISEATETIRTILSTGSIFLCATEPQIDYLRGYLTHCGNFNPPVFPIRTMEKFVRVKKSNWNKELLWFGGVYPWMDINPVIRAILKLKTTMPELNFTVLGPKFRQTLGFETDWENIWLSLKQTERNSLRVIDWVPFNRLNQVLINFSLAVNWAKRTPEDRLAYRSRLVSLLWRGIPLVTNGEDEISALAVRFGAAVKLDIEAQLAPAINKLIKNQTLLKKMSENAGKLMDFLKAENIRTEKELLSVINSIDAVPQTSFYPRLRDKLKSRLYKSKFFWEEAGGKF
ncbi:hypothetical protein HYU89_03215 [Candidatus Collierbacteria bacterium]|nr:hypothetical protein [Candidatus Collierbacteria bacterium]